VLTFCGCNGDGSGSDEVQRLVVTADWLNQSLTLFDYQQLVDPKGDADSSIVRTIDLSEWEPGPIEVDMTPDGKTALVSVGPAFFDVVPAIVGNPEIAAGGTLLIVDLESGIVDEIETKDVPLGIAISADGTTAYSANYGTSDARGDSLSVIDIPGRRLIEEVTVGSGPEQVALSPDGSLGIVNVSGAGGVRIFQTADVAGTMSEVVPTGTDPSDVSFLDGSDRAVVANSFSFDVVLIDTTDPSNPSVISATPLAGVDVGAPYGLTFVPSRDAILAPTNAAGPDLPTRLVIIDRSGDTLSPGGPAQLPAKNAPLTAAADPEGNFAFVAHIVDHRLSIIDLATGQMRAIEWLKEPGPAYVAVQP